MMAETLDAAVVDNINRIKTKYEKLIEELEAKIKELTGYQHEYNKRAIKFIVAQAVRAERGAGVLRSSVG
jgi:hypothetical protein